MAIIPVTEFSDHVPKIDWEIDIRLNEPRFEAVYLGPPHCTKIPWLLNISWGEPNYKSYVRLKFTFQELVDFIDAMNPSSGIIRYCNMRLEIKGYDITHGKSCLCHDYSRWLECTGEKYCDHLEGAKDFPIPKNIGGSHVQNKDA